MKREQAKREIDSLDFYLQNHTDDYGEYSHTAMMMAIKALEQEPCEDCVSREEAIDVCNQSINILEATDRIKDLPPVTPQEPFMNKPCVAHQVCHEDKVKILDKVRAEIADLDDAEYEFEGYYKAVNDALQIIDKYKAESEGEE